MTSAAKRPANIPKFDKVMVWPRNSATGTVRARTSFFIASIPRAQIGGVAFAYITQHRNKEAILGIDRQAEIDLLQETPLHRAAVIPGVEAGRSGAARGDRASQSDRDIGLRRPGLDVGFVGYRRRHDFGVRAGHVDGHRTTHAGQRLDRPGCGLRAGGALDIGAGDRAAGPARANLGQIDPEPLRQSTDSRRRPDRRRLR
jgi:hypothetical protein